MKQFLVAILSAAVLSGCAITGPAGSSASIVGIDHTVQSVSGADGKALKLYVREKHPRGVDLTAFANSGKVVLLAHGAGTPGSVVFDLQVPDNSAASYSLMDHLASHGFDVFTVDLQNYGRSDKLDRATPITQPNLPAFFAALPNTDKQLIILPGAGHALTVQKPRLRFYNEVTKWFSVE